jgi:hypothetical protein
VEAKTITNLVMTTNISYDVQKTQIDSNAEVLDVSKDIKTSAEAIDKSIEYSTPKSSGFVKVKQKKPCTRDTEEREEDTVNMLFWSHV